MWIILNACNDRGIDYRHMIGNSLRTDAEIQKILADIEENKKPKFEEFDTIFTVISKPEQYRNEPSGVFKIKNFQDVENVYPAKVRNAFILKDLCYYGNHLYSTILFNIIFTHKCLFTPTFSWRK